MQLVANTGPHASVATSVMRDVRGREIVVVMIKHAFEWTRWKTVPSRAPVPIELGDRYRGDPTRSSLAAASDLALGKPAVDVVLTGDLVLRTPAESITCGFEIGASLRKLARVHGDRVWTGSRGKLVPSRPQPFDRMPLVWERAYGGTSEQLADRIERRNPVGVGVGTDDEIRGRAAPNLTLASADSDAIRVPVAFAPVAPHWSPRVEAAGTYDEQWRQNRCPLLPEDFDASFFNVAPADQRLPQYESGERVRIIDVTPDGLEEFALPSLATLVRVVDDGYLVERTAHVDTITLRPDARQLTLLSRIAYEPSRDVMAVTKVEVLDLAVA